MYLPKINIEVRLSFVFILFVISASGVFSQNTDIEMLRAINSPEPLPSDDFFRFISNSEPYIVIAVPAGMLTAGFIRHDEFLQRNAFADLAAVAVSGGIVYAEICCRQGQTICNIS